MSLDRLSFRVGIIAGVFLLSGVLIGLALSIGSGRVSTAVSAPAVVAGEGSNGFPAVAKATMPAVVNISTSRVVKSQGGPASPFMDDPMFKHFFGDQFNKQFQIPRTLARPALSGGTICWCGKHRKLTQ